MEMQHCDYFDYWGRGTEVTVSSGQSDKYTGVSVVQVSRSDANPLSYNCSVTHLGGCKSVQVKQVSSSPPRVTLLSVPNGDTQALVCTIEEFLPKTLSVQWKKNGNYESGSTDWVPKQNGDVYPAVSVLKVKNTDWDSKAVYTCEVTHRGKTYMKKASKAPITVTLNPPNPKKFFNNNQAELECIVTGQDNTIVSNTEISWQINGKNVISNIQGTTKNVGSQYSKTSTLTRTRTEWQQVNKVRCSAIREDMTPVIQDLTVHKGDGSKPTVTVHILPEEDIKENSPVTLVCLVSSSVQQVYYIAWSDDAERKTGTYTDGITFLPQKTQSHYYVTSVYTIIKEKWNQQHFVFTYNVWPAGSQDLMKSRGVSKAIAPITVKLNPPSPEIIFNNNQAELECIVTGQDNAIVSNTEITWQINGEKVTSYITGTTKNVGSQYSKTSRLTRTRTEWQQVNKVRCSAIREDMTPVIQDLTVHKGDGSKPTVTVHILPEEDIKENSPVTLVCLVSSSVQQDYYIAWSEDAEQKTGTYTDGITFLPQKTQSHYYVTSVYTITKEKWNQQHFVFTCNVWPAGSNKSMTSRGVSKAMEPELSIALSCTDDSTEEDEFSSLWSTTSSFIFLFIFTLFYNMIFSLVKMKRQ